mgnify:FL=1
MSRVYNFSAGPAVLPEDVLKEAAAEMLDYRGTGMSVMEMSHRSKAYDTIIKEAESDLRDLLHIPDNYKVLFLQGGASQQFAMVPMNLMKNKAADYILTGQWAKKAYQEGAIYGKAAERFLTQSGLRGPLKDKLRMFSTVPQVFSYLTTGELDAGFVNTAVVKAQGKSIGGSIDIQSGYDPIEMVAAVVKGAEKDPEVEAFLTFLQSDKARSVYAKHGLRP